MQVLLNRLLPVCPEIHSPAFCCSALCHRELVLSSCTSLTPLPTGFQPPGVREGNGRHLGKIGGEEEGRSQGISSSLWLDGVLSISSVIPAASLASELLQHIPAMLSAPFRWLQVLGFSNTILSPQGRSFPLSPIFGVGPWFFTCPFCYSKTFLIGFPFFFFFLLNYLKCILLSLLGLN